MDAVKRWKIPATVTGDQTGFFHYPKKGHKLTHNLLNFIALIPLTLTRTDFVGLSFKTPHVYF